MKKPIKETLLFCTQDNLDPLHFACGSGRGVEDAVGTLPNLVLTHLEGAKKFVFYLLIFHPLLIVYSHTF